MWRGPSDQASRHRAGVRRRWPSLLAAGVVVVVVAAVAVLLVIAPQRETADDGPLPPGESTTPVTTTSAPSPPKDPFSVAALSVAKTLSGLDQSLSWAVSATSPDLGSQRPVHPCLTTPPADSSAEHFWVRSFASGQGDSSVRAVQALEVMRSAEVAEATYSRLVESLSSCAPGARQVVGYRVVRGVGAGGSLFSFRFSDDGDVRDEQVAAFHSGTAVISWVVRDSSAHPLSARTLVALAGDSVDAICAAAKGPCSRRPYRLTSRTPPPTDELGFLAVVDLPIFAGVTHPWVATAPQRVSPNPAATECDRADFEAAGARKVLSKSFVVPDEPRLPAIFGMSETVGTFSSRIKAKQFVVTVTQAVAACPDRQLSLAVRRSDELPSKQLSGRVWEIELASSENTSLAFRIALLRVGSTVAQVTFTPTDDFDLKHGAFLRFAGRAAERLGQR